MMGLMTEDPMCEPIPGMATRWTTSPDGLTWTFFLREAAWSDGTLSRHDRAAVLAGRHCTLRELQDVDAAHVVGRVHVATV